MYCLSVIRIPVHWLVAIIGLITKRKLTVNFLDDDFTVIENMELDDSDDSMNSTGITLTFAQIHIHTQDDEGSDVEQQMA